MRVRFDLNLQTWLKNIEIEAISPEQAYQKLLELPIKTLVQVSTAVEQESSITEVDGELRSRNLQVSVYNIVYRDDDFIALNDTDVSQRVLTLPRKENLSIYVPFDGPLTQGLDVVKNGNCMSEAKLNAVTGDEIYYTIKDELEGTLDAGIKVVSFEYTIVEEFDY